MKKTLPIAATEVSKANSIRLARTAVFSGFGLSLRHIDERNQRTSRVKNVNRFQSYKSAHKLSKCVDGLDK